MTATASAIPPKPGADSSDNPTGDKKKGRPIDLLVGATILSFGLGAATQRGCSGPKPPTSGISGHALTATKQFSSFQDALQAVRNRHFIPVDEISSADSVHSAIVFTSVKGKETAILRGITVGKERSEFLRELKALGHELPTSLVSSTTTAVASRDAQLPSGPRSAYEPFIMPATLALLAYAAYRVAGRWGKSFGEMLGKVGQSSPTYTTERPSERLRDWGGNKLTLAIVTQLVSDIKEVMKGNTKIKLPKGGLLSGPPGVGKTFLMKCVAGEADCPIMLLGAAELRTSPYMGSRAKGIEDLLAAARDARDKKTKELRSLPEATGKEQGVVIIVLDEFESVARTRAPGSNENENSDAINTLLANTDGANSARNHNIIILGATNHIDVIDPALRRPGRFHTELKIDSPATSDDRLDVLEKLLPKVFKDSDCLPPSKESLSFLAEAVSGATPADLGAMLEESQRSAAAGQTISLDELLSAYQTVKIGPLRQSNEREQRKLICSAHEFGHALVALAFDIDPVIISMRARGTSLGRVVLNLGSLLEPPHVASDFIKLMTIMAAGRGGELAFLGGTGEASDGVGSDFQNISDYSKVFLSTGMLDGTYALQLTGTKDAELQQHQQTALEAIGDVSVLAAAEILRSISNDRFDQIAQNAMDREFFGPKAKEYLTSCLSADELAAIKEAGRRVISQFSNSVYQQLGQPNPVERSKQTKQKLAEILNSSTTSQATSLNTM